VLLEFGSVVPFYSHGKDRLSKPMQGCVGRTKVHGARPDRRHFVWVVHPRWSLGYVGKGKIDPAHKDHILLWSFDVPSRHPRRVQEYLALGSFRHGLLCCVGNMQNTRLPQVAPRSRKGRNGYRPFRKSCSSFLVKLLSRIYRFEAYSPNRSEIRTAALAASNSSQRTNRDRKTSVLTCVGVIVVALATGRVHGPGVDEDVPGTLPLVVLPQLLGCRWLLR